MVANILVLVFLALMTYWWGVQGVFYALLHLLTVILAGALALAIWEPLTVRWLLPRMPWYAWGVGLLGPFALFLILFRVSIDRLLKRSPQCGQLANVMVGGFLGLLSAILTAGLTIIGLGFMPFGADVAGYQPYVVDTDGRVIENPDSGWWVVPVDQVTSNFFSRVSSGALEPMSGRSLALYQPSLMRQAALFRLHRDNYDRHASPAATPTGVSVVNYETSSWPDDSLDPGTRILIDQQAKRLLGESSENSGRRLVMVQTRWTRKNDVGTYDKNTLRVFPTQIRLLAFAERRGRTESRLFAPVGVNWEDTTTRLRVYLPFNDNRAFPWSASETSELRWVFVVPEGYTPQSLLARNLRLKLVKAKEPTKESLAALIGKPGEGTTPAAPQDNQPRIGLRHGPRVGSKITQIEMTDELPKPFSIDSARGLEFSGDGLLSGSSTVSLKLGRRDRRCSRVFVERQLASVRLKLASDAARSLLGQARARAAAINGVWLVDNHHQQWYPSGYVMLKKDRANKMTVKFNRDMPIRSATELPTRTMGDNDELYLYFFVERNIRILKYQVGTTVTDVSLVVPPN